MRLQGLILTATAGVAVAVAGGVLAQAARAGQAVSLGELARQQRAQRATGQEKPKKVYTNDNLPPKASGGVSVAGQMSATVEVSQGGESAQVGDTGAAQGADVHDEKYYRKTMSGLRTRLDFHKRELSVLEQKLSQGSTQFYTDPNKTLQEEFSRSGINKLQEDIEKKKADIAADEQAISDLEDQLRREGAPPGWLR